MIIGPSTVAEVSWREEKFAQFPQEGQQVNLLAVVGVFRDDDSLDFVRWIDAPAPQGQRAAAAPPAQEVKN